MCLCLCLCVQSTAHSFLSPATQASSAAAVDHAVLRTLCTVPTLDTASATKLLTHFGSLQTVALAPASALSEVLRKEEGAAAAAASTNKVSAKAQKISAFFHAPPNKS
jgi:hypothetical protein